MPSQRSIDLSNTHAQSCFTTHGNLDYRILTVLTLAALLPQPRKCCTVGVCHYTQRSGALFQSSPLFFLPVVLEEVTFNTV